METQIAVKRTETRRRRHHRPDHRTSPVATIYDGIATELLDFAVTVPASERPGVRRVYRDWN